MTHKHGRFGECAFGEGEDQTPWKMTETPKHLSVFIWALGDVQDAVHLHVVRVKRLVVHLGGAKIRVMVRWL